MSKKEKAMSRRHHQSDVIIQDNTKYDDINFKGLLQSDYDIEAKSLNGMGELNTARNITVEQLKFKGRFKAGHVHAVNIKIHGRVQAESLSAENIKIVAGRKCTVGSIHGDNIELRRDGDAQRDIKLLEGILKLVHIDPHDILSHTSNNEDAQTSPFLALEIEGTNIDLTNIRSKSVMGVSVVLKGNCQIDKVVYSDSLVIDESCNVKSIQKQEI